jgi:hypothetical protein
MADHERHPALFLADVDMAKARPGIRFKPWDEQLPESLDPLVRKNVRKILPLSRTSLGMCCICESCVIIKTLSAGWRGEWGELVARKKSTIPFADQSHLRPQGQSGRGEAANALPGRAEPASVRPLVRRMAGRMKAACGAKEKHDPIR